MYYFIVNYTGGSGNARRTWNRVHYLLNEKNIEYKAYVTKKQGHAKKLAEKISSFEDDDIMLIVVGGDVCLNLDIFLQKFITFGMLIGLCMNFSLLTTFFAIVC